MGRAVVDRPNVVQVLVSGIQSTARVRDLVYVLKVSGRRYYYGYHGARCHTHGQPARPTMRETPCRDFRELLGHIDLSYPSIRKYKFPQKGDAFPSRCFPNQVEHTQLTWRRWKDLVPIEIFPYGRISRRLRYPHRRDIQFGFFVSEGLLACMLPK